MTDASKTFVVSVERATPACSEACRNLKIDENTMVAHVLNGNLTVRSFVCVNADYCKELWKTMKKNMPT